MTDWRPLTDRNVAMRRAAMFERARQYFSDQGLLAVDTPALSRYATSDPNIESLGVRSQPGKDGFLHTSPELAMKRLLAAGFRDIYEMGRVFRAGESGRYHNPEFTMLEFYWAFADYEDLMVLTEAMLSEMAVAVSGGSIVPYQGQDIDFSGPYERLSVEEAVRRFNPKLADADLWNEEFLRAACEGLQIHTEKSWGAGRLLTELFEDTVEEHLVQPTFITGYPTEVSPLSRRNDAKPEITDRFELFICGREIANGFSELNDAEDQAERFRKQVEEKDAGDLEAMHYDADYIRALEHGMPPTAGEGIGIDRLVMLFTDSPSIRDVLLFPHMRPEG